MRFVLGFALALTLLATRANADEPQPIAAGAARIAAPIGPPDESARPTFEAGRRAFEAGRYAEALEAFQRVFVLTGHPAMLINIANSHARLGENRRAAASLEQYLAMMPEAGDRSLLEARIAALYAQPDSVALPPPPPTPAPTPPAAPAPPPRVAEPEQSSGFIAGRTFTWVALGTSVAFAGAAGLVWLDANQNFERLALTCGVDGRCSDAQLEAVSDSVTATNLCLAASALTLAASIVLYVVEGEDAEKPPSQIAAGFDGKNAMLSISGRL